MDMLWVELLLIAVAVGILGQRAVRRLGDRARLVSDQSPGRDARPIGTRLRDRVELKETPNTFLATIQIAIIAVGTLASVAGGAPAVEVLSPLLERLADTTVAKSDTLSAV